jgi:hypothetical protein
MIIPPSNLLRPAPGENRCQIDPSAAGFVVDKEHPLGHKRQPPNDLTSMI